MRKRIKGILALFIAVVMLAGLISVPVQAKEGDGQEKGLENTDTDMDIHVSSTDSFGDMVAEKIYEETEEQQSNNGCNIYSVEMNGNQARVSFETVKDGSLVVAIYDESGVEMLASGSKEVYAGEKEAEVIIETSQMPQYFYVRAFLVNKWTFKPYCTSYETPNYTKEMQEFLAKTTEDFTGRDILDLDGDSENNFAVYKEGTVVVSEAENVNQIIQANEEKEQYVIENADEKVKGLKAGEILACERQDGSVLIVKIDTIQIDGNAVTITEADTEMEEVFDYIKIDTEQGTESAAIDPSTCDEGVTYNGLVEWQEDEIQTQAIEGEGKTSKAVSMKLDKTIGAVKLAGGVELNLEASVKLYASFLINTWK